MVVLSHETALRYWLSPSAVAAVDAGALRGVRPSFPSRSDVRALGACGFGLPVHVLMPRDVSRTRRESVARHDVPEAAFEGRVYRVGPDLLACDPATAYVQACSKMDLVSGVFWGNALCGEYVVSDDEEAGFRARAAVARREELRSRAAVRFMHGARHARQALRYVCDGAASPMENALAVKLALPLSCGGAGFPDVQLNRRLNVPERLQKTAGRTYYKCDAFLPESGVAIEYDSDAFHTGADRIASDARRRNTLEAMGVTVVTVTRRQLVDPREFFGIVQRLYAISGRRLQTRYDPLERQVALGRSVAALLRASKAAPQRLSAPPFFA